MVGASNSARGGRRRPRASWIRATTRAASRECPPSSKKRSSIPMAETFRTSDQISARVVSSAVRGATIRERSPEISGFGSALRSTLPLGLNGSASSTTK